MEPNFGSTPGSCLTTGVTTGARKKSRKSRSFKYASRVGSLKDQGFAEESFPALVRMSQPDFKKKNSEVTFMTLKFSESAGSSSRSTSVAQAASVASVSEIQTVRMDAFIARGSMGQVFRVCRIDDVKEEQQEKHFALKIIDVKTPAQLLDAWRECQTMLDLGKEADTSSDLGDLALASSDHIVRVVNAGVHVKLSVIFILMELGDCDLESHAGNLRAAPGTGPEIGPEMLSLPQLLHFSLQMTAALRGVHGLKFLHLDIKPENFLLFAERDGSRLKLSDFGLARPLQSRALESSSRHRSHLCRESTTNSSSFSSHLTLPNPCGSLYYMAPEVVFQEQSAENDFVLRVSPKADIWSLALVFYRIAFLCLPWGLPNLRRPQRLQFIISHKSLRVLFPPHQRWALQPADGADPGSAADPLDNYSLPFLMYMQALSRCLSRDAAKRPTVWELETLLRDCCEEIRSTPGTPRTDENVQNDIERKREIAASIPWASGQKLYSTALSTASSSVTADCSASVRKASRPHLDAGGAANSVSSPARNVHARTGTFDMDLRTTSAQSCNGAGAAPATTEIDLLGELRESFVAPAGESLVTETCTTSSTPSSRSSAEFEDWPKRVRPDQSANHSENDDAPADAKSQLMPETARTNATATEGTDSVLEVVSASVALADGAFAEVALAEVAALLSLVLLLAVGLGIALGECWRPPSGAPSGPFQTLANTGKPLGASDAVPVEPRAELPRPVGALFELVSSRAQTKVQKYNEVRSKWSVRPHGDMTRRFSKGPRPGRSTASVDTSRYDEAAPAADAVFTLESCFHEDMQDKLRRTFRFAGEGENSSDDVRRRARQQALLYVTETHKYLFLDYFVSEYEVTSSYHCPFSTHALTELKSSSASEDTEPRWADTSWSWEKRFSLEFQFDRDVLLREADRVMLRGARDARAFVLDPRFEEQFRQYVSLSTMVIAAHNLAPDSREIEAEVKKLRDTFRAKMDLRQSPGAVSVDIAGGSRDGSLSRLLALIQTGTEGMFAKASLSAGSRPWSLRENFTTPILKKRIAEAVRERLRERRGPGDSRVVPKIPIAIPVDEVVDRIVQIFEYVWFDFFVLSAQVLLFPRVSETRSSHPLELRTVRALYLRRMRALLSRFETEEAAADDSGTRFCRAEFALLKRLYAAGREEENSVQARVDMIFQLDESSDHFRFLSTVERREKIRCDPTWGRAGV